MREANLPHASTRDHEEFLSPGPTHAIVLRCKSRCLRLNLASLARWATASKKRSVVRPMAAIRCPPTQP
uniref:Uncharacterized protein n=1 Tax=Setaria italica TaxID=4555 RepID=K3Y0N1_SETIT